MPTFYLTNTTSDLTGGVHWTTVLGVSPTSSSLSVSLSAGQTDVRDYSYTPAGALNDQPVSSTGTWTFTLNVSSGNSNIQCAVYIARTDSAGTLQAVVGPTAAQSLGSAGAHNFSFVNPALGTFAATDRIRVMFSFTSTAAHGSNSVTLDASSASFLNAPAGTVVTNATATPGTISGSTTVASATANDGSPVVGNSRSNTCEGPVGTSVSLSNTNGPDQFTSVTATGTGTTKTFDNAHTHQGSSSILFHNAAIASTNYMDWSGVPDASNVYLRFYMYTGAQPTANTRVAAFIGAGALRGSLQWITSGVLRIVSSPGGTQSSSTMTTTVPLNQWVRVEFEITGMSGGVGNAAARIFSGANLEGTTPDEEIVWTAMSVGASDISNDVRIGMSSSFTPTTAWDVWYDDIAYSDAIQPGPSITSQDATASPALVSGATTTSAPTVAAGSGGIDVSPAPSAIACTTTMDAPQAYPIFTIVVADMQPGAAVNPPPSVVAANVVADDPLYVIMPGDLANDGTSTQYGFFNTMYGSLKSRIYPVPGNHDWVPGNLTAYDAYWGTQSRSGNTPPHAYSFDIGRWHVIGIDSDEAFTGSVNNPSPTYTFVANDLATVGDRPIIAFWHHSRWSEGTNTTDPGGTGDSVTTEDIWNLLYDYNADIVFTGHTHSMQRFPKFGKTGLPDANGIREFVAGCGGSGLFTLNATGRRTEFDSYQSTAYDQLNSQFFGHLRVWLYHDAYSWEFVSQQGNVLDSGGPIATNSASTSTPATASPSALAGTASISSPTITAEDNSGPVTLNIALVVADATTPTANDIVEHDMLVAAGHTVTYLTDDNGLPSTGYDVVRIVESVSGSSAAVSGMATCPLPVVYSDTGLTSMNLATSNASSSGSDTIIDIVNNTHAITSGVPDPTTIFTASTQIYTAATSSLASGAVVLATFPGVATAAALVVADTGATLTSGTALNRRAYIGFGVNSSSPPRWTTDAQMLILNTVEWAANKLVTEKTVDATLVQATTSIFTPSVVAPNPNATTFPSTLTITATVGGGTASAGAPLPGLIDGVEPEAAGGWQGPHIDSNGSLYRVQEEYLNDPDTGTIQPGYGNHPMLMKSADGGGTWVRMDAVNGPGYGAGVSSGNSYNDMESAWLVHRPTHHELVVLYCKAQSRWWGVSYRTSDHPTNPDTWDQATFATTSGQDRFTTEANESGISGAVLSDGSVRAFIRGDPQGGFQAFLHRFKAATGDWDTALNYITEPFNMTRPISVTGENDTVYLFYRDDSNGRVYYRTISSTGTVSSSTRVDTNGAGTDPGTGATGDYVNNLLPAVYYDSGGTPVVVTGFVNDSNILRTVEVRGGVVGEEQVVSSDVVTVNALDLNGTTRTDNEGPSAAIAVAGTTLYAFWANDANGKVYYATRPDGGSWSAKTLLVDSPAGTTINWMYANKIVKPDGSTYIGYTYDVGPHDDDDSNTMYNQLLVSAGAVDATVNASALSLTTTVGAPTTAAGSGATVSVASITGTTSVPTPTVAAAISATASPTTISRTVTIGAPVVAAGTGASPTPVSIAVATSVPESVTHAGATSHPVAVAGAASVPAATVTTGTGTTATPVSLTATTTVPAGTVHISTTATPNAIARVAAVPAGTVTAGTGATASPSVVGATAAVPGAVAHASGRATPTLVSAATAVPGAVAAAGGGANATPTRVSATTAVPAAAGHVSVTASPARVSATTAVPAGTAHISVKAAPVVVASSTIVPAATVAASVAATATPAQVTGAAAVPSPTVAAAISAAPAPARVVATTVMPAPSVVAGSSTGATPLLVSGATSVPIATAHAAVKVTPASISATSAVLAATGVAGTGATASTVSLALTTATPAAAAHAGATATTTSIAGATVIGSAAVIAGGSAAAAPGGVVAHTAVPTPGVVAGGRANVALVSGAATVLVPGVVAGSSTGATPVSVSAHTSMFTPSIESDEGVTAQTIEAAATVPTPSVSAGTAAGASAVVINGVTSVSAGTAAAGGKPTPQTVASATSVPSASAGAGSSATATPGAIAGATVIPMPSIVSGGSATAAPMSISSTTVVGNIVPSASTTATPAAVAGSTTVVFANADGTHMLEFTGLGQLGIGGVAGHGGTIELSGSGALALQVTMGVVQTVNFLGEGTLTSEAFVTASGFLELEGNGQFSAFSGVLYPVNITITVGPTRNTAAASVQSTRSGAQADVAVVTNQNANVGPTRG